MEDPVITRDGHTYEKKAIEKWLKGGHRTDPLTKASLSLSDLSPNRAVKNYIEDFWRRQNHSVKNNIEEIWIEEEQQKQHTIVNLLLLEEEEEQEQEQEQQQVEGQIVGQMTDVWAQEEGEEL
jgi:hypothetical protein